MMLSFFIWIINWICPSIRVNILLYCMRWVLVSGGKKRNFYKSVDILKNIVYKLGSNSNY